MVNSISMSIYHGPPKATCLEVFMVNNLVFKWPKPLFFMVLGAHGIQCLQRHDLKSQWFCKRIMKQQSFVRTYFFSCQHHIGTGSEPIIIDGFYRSNQHGTGFSGERCERCKRLTDLIIFHFGCLGANCHYVTEYYWCLSNFRHTYIDFFFWLFLLQKTYNSPNISGT